MALWASLLALPKWAKALIVTAILAASVAGYSYWQGHHDAAESAKPKIEAAADKASVKGLEAEGAQDTARQVEVIIRQANAAQAVSSQLAVQAAKAEDANAPLDPARADRLHASDRSLCALRPSLVGCAADRDASVR